MRSIRRAALLLAAALALTLCGCTGGGQEKVTLTVMGKTSDINKSYMTRIFDLYEEATGGHIKTVAIEDEEFEARALELITGGEGPDILMHFNTTELQPFDVPHRFLYLNDQEWVDELTDGALAYCQDSDGNLLGLPFWENSVSGCYYNRTLLEMYGLRPATTQAEFDMLCDALLDVGLVPICWPADGCSWMYQFGLDPVFADDPELLDRLNSGEITYSQIPQVLDMVNWISGAANSGWFGDSALSTGWDDVSRDLASGRAVMTFIWDTWFYTDFTPDKFTVDDFALMPVFMGTADSGTYEGGNLNMMMVNKDSEHLDEALAFLSFCAAPENYNKAFDGISTVKCFKGQTTNIQSPMVTDAAASIASLERVSTAASRIVGYSATDTASAVNQLLRGKTDPEGCVRLMDESRSRHLQVAE